MTASVEVPQYVAEETTARWPNVGPQWVSEAPGELRQLCEQYGAIPETVLPARYGLVVAVQAKDRELIMKGSPDPDGPNQVKVMSALADLQVGPTILESFSTDTGFWTIMTRIKPGEPLRNLGASLAPPDKLATILRPLVNQPSPSSTLPYIGDWLRDRLEDDALSDLAPGRTVASETERSEALSVLSELTDAGAQGLCHGDTSPGNILTGENGKLYLIDPRGMRGEAAYDVAVLGLKSAMTVSPETRVSDLAKAVGVDVGRAERWAAIALAARV
ncbi:aminoglycoside phosphotransferase family protein [Stackebrandtia nassauensis]|uniref:Aminoglycoside phosphotransferase n=1 Tax=Stackebrandtia nassauensis (strain DSM 44728 / CIP 108903 / NRRL B-16338 / NBRC 102104 / LLR-40K-21) TaxID=446470 RepID=D3Q375_STANL|nr:aminoglycoside phosphotransferase family protein [Stackebrandtia nassauensis]ADD40045.1 aminoglycoside phosphotransferase [Stackebrandtia nassauensis DSM 44728]